VASPTSTAQVTELVRALAVAWKNLTAYPPGHPALNRSLEAAHKRLVELRGPSSGGDVTFGIASDAIVYGDERIESSHVQKFAQALYHRGVAVVRFDAEAGTQDLDKFLRLLGSGAPGESKDPLWEQLSAAGVLHITLTPVDYSAVMMTDEIAAEREPKKGQSIWDDILEALVAGRELTPDAKEILERHIRSVEELSSMLLEYMDVVAAQAHREFDPNATFGVKMAGTSSDSPDAAKARVAEAIALHIGSSSGTKRQLAVQQVTQLLKTLPPALRESVIRSVLRVLGTDETTGGLMRDFVRDLSNDEVLDALQHLASSSQLSSHAMMVLQSLAAMDSHDDVAPAPPTLVADLVNLFGEDDPDRFNPPDHRLLLKTVAVEMPQMQNVAPASEKLGDRVDTIAADAVDRTLAQTLLDLLEKATGSAGGRQLLARIVPVFITQLAAARFDDALEIVQRLQLIGRTSASDDVRNAVDETLARMGSPETLRSLVDSMVNVPPDKTASIQRLTEALGSSATHSLLNALASESSRSRRRKLFDFMASLGPRIVPEVVPFLTDSRWYVIRNMIVLLRTVQDRTSLPQIREVAHHSDLRVRLEAIKTLLAFDKNVPTNLLETAINDPDPKLAETAIALVGNYGIREGVPPLLQILSQRDIFGSRRALRLRAIKALGELAEPSALQPLDRFFSDPFLPWPAVEERRAAFESLAAYPPEVRAPYVERGLNSRDAVVREICKRLQH
jgi:HEAT repeat protein